MEGNDSQKSMYLAFYFFYSSQGESVYLHLHMSLYCFNIRATVNI